MNVCPNCKHANIEGSLFCEECGAQLTGREMVTQTIETSEIKDELQARISTKAFQMQASEDTWANLHMLDTGQVLPLSGRREFTLGRISEDQPIMPDIDLSAYQAYSSGVSRMHAMIKSDGRKVIVMDLGSANGTYVNGRRLTSNIEQGLNHGDVLALGKLKMQILLK